MLHEDYILAKKLIYDRCNFECTPPVKEEESADYGASVFKLNSLAIRFRVAKITPTKIGQFVTLWKRIGDGPIMPFDVRDPIDLFIISTRKDENFGQFVFPKSILCKHGVLTNNGKEGKRAIRVYPPWDKTSSKQAQKTQKWQLEYFLSIPLENEIDRGRAELLFCSSN
jgi:hypothetical protein